MNTKHTPGPWIALERYTNRQAIPIGYRSGPNEHSIFAEAHGHNCEANARLIAAAPELLEALKEMIDTHCALGDLRPENWHKAKKAVRMAQGLD